MYNRAYSSMHFFLVFEGLFLSSMLLLLHCYEDREDSHASTFVLGSKLPQFLSLTNHKILTVIGVTLRLN